MIAVGGELNGLTEQLKISSVDRPSQIVHLISEVVDVILRFDIVTRRAHDVDDCRSRRRPAPMPDMKFAGGIGADIFDLDRAVTLIRQLTVPIAGIEYRTEVIINDRRLKIEIHESRTRDLDPVEQLSINAFENGIGDLARARAKDFCGLHCEVGSEVPEFLLGRHLELNIDLINGFQHAVVDSLPDRVLHSVNDHCLYLQ